MIIESYDVKANSRRAFVSVESRTMSAKRKLRTVPETVTESETSEEDRIVISERAKNLAKHNTERNFDDGVASVNRKTASTETISPVSDPQTPQDSVELKLRMLETMLEVLTGRRARMRMQAITGGGECSHNPGSLYLSGGGNEGGNVGHLYFESERVSYQPRGIIQTADGRMISVDISMFMSYEFAAYMSISIELTRAVDPLILNYGGTAASMLDEKFDFDLTLDRTSEQVSVPGEDSGLLVASRYGDWKAGDGSVLSEQNAVNTLDGLRTYDSVRNGWVDGNDDIFSKLRIRSSDKDGNDQVFTLENTSAGVASPVDNNARFSFQNIHNNSNGIMRSASLFLKDNSSATTVSYLDMTI